MSLKRYMQVLSAVAAVVAFSAVAAGAAQAAGDAPRYTVGAETPLAGKSFPVTGKSTAEPGKLEVPGLFTLLNKKEKCTVTGNLVGSAANTPGTASAVVLTCTGVEFEGELNKTCVVHSTGQPDGTVKTETLVGTLVWLASTGHSAGLTLTPAAETNGLFVNLEVTDNPANPFCPIKGTYGAKGSVIGKAETPATDAVTQTIEFTNPPITKSFDNSTPLPRKQFALEDKLTVGNKAAQFTNTFDLTLTSGASWGVETG